MENYLHSFTDMEDLIRNLSTEVLVELSNKPFDIEDMARKQLSIRGLNSHGVHIGLSQSKSEHDRWETLNNALKHARDYTKKHGGNFTDNLLKIMH